MGSIGYFELVRDNSNMKGSAKMPDKYPRYRIMIQIEDSLDGQYDGPRFELHKDDNENDAINIFKEILVNLEAIEEDT